MNVLCTLREVLSNLWVVLQSFLQLWLVFLPKQCIPKLLEASCLIIRLLIFTGDQPSPNGSNFLTPRKWHFLGSKSNYSSNTKKKRKFLRLSGRSIDHVSTSVFAQLYWLLQPRHERWSANYSEFGAWWGVSLARRRVGPLALHRVESQQQIHAQQLVCEAEEIEERPKQRYRVRWQVQSSSLCTPLQEATDVWRLQATEDCGERSLWKGTERPPLA